MKLIQALCVLFFMLFSSAAYCAEQPVSSPENSISHNIYNAHIVEPGVIRGSQPSGNDLYILKNYYYVKTILSFVEDGTWRNKWEKDAAKALGMEYINIPIDETKKQGPDTIEKAISIIADKSKKPIFVHCTAGKDRAGLIFAAYRIKYNNWSFDDAYTEMRAYAYDELRLPQVKQSLKEWYEWYKKEGHDKAAN